MVTIREQREAFERVETFVNAWTSPNPKYGDFPETIQTIEMDSFYDIGPTTIIDLKAGDLQVLLAERKQLQKTIRELRRKPRRSV